MELACHTRILRKGTGWGSRGAGSSPAVADGLSEETQVLVDLQAVLQSKDCFLIVLEDGQSISEHHLGHSGGSGGVPRQVRCGEKLRDSGNVEVSDRPEWKPRGTRCGCSQRDR